MDRKAEHLHQDKKMAMFSLIKNSLLKQYRKERKDFYGDLSQTR